MKNMSLSESQYKKVLEQNKHFYQELCARRKVEERIKNIVVSMCVHNKWQSEEEFLSVKAEDLQDMPYLGQKILKVLKDLSE